MKKISKCLIVIIFTFSAALSLTACGLFGGSGIGGGGDGTQTPKSVIVTLVPNGGTVEKLTIIGEAGSARRLLGAIITLLLKE